jgi:hypothetical protein
MNFFLFGLIYRSLKLKDWKREKNENEERRMKKKARSRQTRRLLIVPFKKNYASNE